MPHRVFISYASENADFAKAIYAQLKSAGVTCWIDKHDISPGGSWLTAIMQAIKTCDMMLLLLCSKANLSQHVLTETERAFHYKKKILAVRLEDLTPCDDLEFLLSRHQWLETHGLSTEAARHRIVEAVKALAESTEPAPNLPVPGDPLDLMPLDELVKEGIGLVSDEIEKLSAMETPVTPREVFRVLDTAIYYGAPAYNRGSIIGCAEIYLTTCKGLARALGTGTIPSDVPWSSPFNRFVSRMKTIQANTPRAEKLTANRLAWDLRHAFDGFHAALGIQEVQDLMEQIQATHLPIRRDVVLLPVLVAIQHGNRVFEAKDLEGCAELHHDTAGRVCRFLEGAASKSSLRSDPHLFLFHQDLKDILKKHPKVEPADTQNLAWDLYSTFLQIIKAPPG